MQICSRVRLFNLSQIIQQASAIILYGTIGMTRAHGHSGLSHINILYFSSVAFRLQTVPHSCMLERVGSSGKFTEAPEFLEVQEFYANQISA